MTINRNWTVASTIALAIGLTACGGGGGGVASMPAPPMTPTLTPTPTPTPTPTGMAVISAPTAASTGSSPGTVLATTGGANFTTGPAAGQLFPLLQTTLVLDTTSIKPDSATNAKGGTATVESGKMTLSIAGFTGMDTVPAFGADAAATSTANANLDWTRVGYWSTGGVWDYWEDIVRHRGVFVAGYETPAAAMPTTGSATYTGKANGSVFYPVAQGSGIAPCNCDETPVSGIASFTANFGTRSLAGSLTDMRSPHPWDENAPAVPWNDVALSATISGNAFSGDARVTNDPHGPFSMAPTATGTVVGKFFGPGANEAGAVWTLFDGTRAAIGTLTGKRP